MMKINIYSAKGIRKGSTNLPKNLVEKENLFLLAQAVRVYEDRLHPKRGKTKTRGEVYASGAKIWRQKGTCRARHGSLAAPIFVGGGIAHGPRGVKKTLSLPKKIRQKALKVALGLKAKEGQLIVAENLSRLKKTNDAQKFISTVENKELNGKRPIKVSLVLARKNASARVVFRNIKNILVLDFDDLNARKVFLGGFLIVDKDALNEKSTLRTSKKSTKKSKIETEKVDKKISRKRKNGGRSARKIRS